LTATRTQFEIDDTKVNEFDQFEFDTTTPLNIVSNDAQLAISELSKGDTKISAYWLGQLSKIDRPVARNLISQLSPSNALGYENIRINSLTASSGTLSRSPGSLLEYTIQQKNKHPNCVILMRCGEFYETYGCTSFCAFSLVVLFHFMSGVDALMMIAYAGLNPMANRCKAGCPVRNIQATLDALTHAGLSVAGQLPLFLINSHLYGRMY